MKLIIAYIKPEKLNDVKRELFARSLTRMSVTTALGCGKQMGFIETYRGVEEEVNLLKKMRIEIAVTDEQHDATIDAIIKGAATGEIGDGKIFVVALEECIRIRTNERGNEAIG